MATNNMQDIKRRIRSITSTEHITNAMKLVSSAKLRRARATYDSTHQYFHFITDSIGSIFKDVGNVPSKYLARHREGQDRACYIIISSSKGLCGGFNGNVIKLAEQEIQKYPNNPLIVTIGTKGRDYFEKRGYKIFADCDIPPEEMTINDVRELLMPVLEKFESEEIDEVIMVYTSYISPLQQQASSLTLLPFAESLNVAYEEKKDVEYEPSAEEVFDYLVPKYLEIKMYGAVISSATCEHAARRMAMENATDNAREMLGSLSLFYNRARQAAITNEIIEVVSGSEAQKG